MRVLKWLLMAYVWMMILLIISIAMLASLISRLRGYEEPPIV